MLIYAPGQAFRLNLSPFDLGFCSSILEEVAAELGFVVFAGEIGNSVVVEALDELEDDSRRGYWPSLYCVG